MIDTRVACRTGGDTHTIGSKSGGEALVPQGMKRDHPRENAGTKGHNLVTMWRRVIVLHFAVLRRTHVIPW
jgi:hypothetical protein